MTEFVVEPLTATDLPGDVFVSLRVGDVQKLSKLGPGKSYKFPPAALKGRKYGKLELFRRVGSCSIAVDEASANSVQEVCMPEVSEDMKLRVCMSGPKQAPKLDFDQNPKVHAAKEYLDKHHLELRLAEVMQAVLRERPENPAEFISQKLLGNAHMVSTVPHKPNSQVPQPPPTPTKPVPQSVEPVADAQAEATSDEPLPGQPRGFAHMPSVGTWCQRRPIGPKPIATPVPAAEPPASTETGVVARGFGCGLGSATPIGTGYGMGAVAKGPSSWQQQPSVASWCASPVKPRMMPAEATPAAAEPQPFLHRPSVGTWCLPKPTSLAEDEVSAPVQAESQGQAPLQPPFALRPSVGTWCLPRPCASEAEEAPALVEETVKTVCDKPWALRPSVGTWCQSLPKPTSEPVATTVAKLAAADAPAALSQAPAPRRMLMPTSTLLGPGFASMGLRPGFRVL